MARSILLATSRVSNLHMKLLGRLRMLHPWVILALFALITAMHYAEQAGLPWCTPPSYHFGLTRHALDRILFLVPLIYIGYAFGPVAGYFGCLAAFLIMLPRAIAISPAPVDALLEILGVVLVATLANALLGKGAKARERLLKALVDLLTKQE
ncbi:MAG: hypothetical protein V1737_05650 [Chloroflexota bacterium]